MFGTPGEEDPSEPKLEKEGSATSEPPVSLSQTELAAEYTPAQERLRGERRTYLARANEYLAPRFWANLQERLQTNPPQNPRDKEAFAHLLDAELDQLGLGVRCPKKGVVAHFRVTARGDFQLIPHGHNNPSLSSMDVGKFFAELIADKPLELALAVSTTSARRRGSPSPP